MELFKRLGVLTLLFLPILASAEQKLEVTADISIKANIGAISLFDTGTFKCELTFPPIPFDRMLGKGALIALTGDGKLNLRELDELELFGLAGVRIPGEYDKAIQIFTSDVSPGEKKAQLRAAFPSLPTIQYSMELQARSLRTDTEMPINCSGDQEFGLSDILLNLHNLSQVKPSSNL